MEFETELTIQLPEGELTDVKAVFDIDTETIDAEPYSWGQNRASETSVRAELLTLRLGSLKLTRDLVCEMLSSTQVAAMEGRAETAYLGE
jgi:hypothetical protein